MGRVVYLNSEVLYYGKWIPNHFFSKIKGIKTRRSLLSLFVCDCHGGFQLSLKEGGETAICLGRGVRGNGVGIILLRTKKKKGGLGVMCLSTMNKALLCKWNWRFAYES